MAFRNHRFSRLELLIGKEGLSRFRSKHVVIVGVGGVGGFAAEALARGAVGKITLVDHDEICATNVNRQIQAFTHTVGKKKVDVLAERLRGINPHLEVQTIAEHHHPERGDFILEEASKLAPIDAVLDCIDTVLPKVDLIERCLSKNISIFSSTGAASKLDPSKIKVGDISETTMDPLARQIRLMLKAKGIHKGVKVIYSTEKPYDPAEIVPGTEWNCICTTVDKEFGACVQKRLMLGTTSYLPPIFGMWLAGELMQSWISDLDLNDRKEPGYIPTQEELLRTKNSSTLNSLEL